MLEALSAEALKMRGHKATWFLVWLFPIACTIIMTLIIILRVTGIEPPEHQAAADWSAPAPISSG